MMLVSMDRESFVLKNLTDCSVYLLDYSGEVEVSNVVNSQIFIGICLIPGVDSVPRTSGLPSLAQAKGGIQPY